MKSKCFLFSLVIIMSGHLYGQASEVESPNVKQWTLQECIDYALDQNIQLRQNKISTLESEIDVKSARASLFPSLSFNSGHNITNRPYQQNSSTVNGTEIITSNNKTTYSGNYGLSANWTVWDGNKKVNNLKKQKLNNQIAELNVEQTENSLQEQITQLFIQILYANESVRINENTVEVSQSTYNRGNDLYREGSISKVDLAQLEAQLSNDKYLLVTSENTLRNYKLQLKQLLELDGTEEMQLILPQISDDEVLKLLPNQADIYQQALAYRPEIESSRLNIENSKLGISIAKAGYLPTINLNASSSSMTNNASELSWSKQIKNGWNNVIGFSLSLPLFDNRQTKSAVQKARLQYDSNQLELINKQKELYQTVEGMYIDALNAQEQYRAAEANQMSYQTSYDLVSEQFNLGMKNTIELLTEKNNLLNAQQQRIQAKYMAILNRALLEFYASGKIEIV